MKAEVTLLPSDQGGRKGPTPYECWRVIVRVGNSSRDVRFYFRVGQRAEPGGPSRLVHMVMLTPESAALFPVGMDFEIWEGRVVGRGVVTSMDPSTAHESP